MASAEDTQVDYRCRECREVLDYEGLFGPRGSKFRRFTCETEGCGERGTSWPESTLRRVAS